MTFSIARKDAFRYTLDGDDDGWHEASPVRQALEKHRCALGDAYVPVMVARRDGVGNECVGTLSSLLLLWTNETTCFVLSRRRRLWVLLWWCLFDDWIVRGPTRVCAAMLCMGRRTHAHRA